MLVRKSKPLPSTFDTKALTFAVPSQNHSQMNSSTGSPHSNADRLTPRIRSGLLERQSPPHSSPAIGKARAIVKKYRRHVRNVEFKKLRSVVPSISENEKVSQTEILEETIRYIDSLHQKLLERIQTDGIPDQLKEKVPLRQLNSVSGSNLTKTQLKSLMKNAFQDQFSMNLTKKKQLDAERLRILLLKNNTEGPHRTSSPHLRTSS